MRRAGNRVPLAAAILVTNVVVSCDRHNDGVAVQHEVVRYQLEIQLERYKKLSRLICITLANADATRPRRDPSVAFVKRVQHYTDQRLVAWSACDAEAVRLDRKVMRLGVGEVRWLDDAHATVSAWSPDGRYLHTLQRTDAGWSVKEASKTAPGDSFPE